MQLKAFSPTAVSTDKRTRRVFARCLYTSQLQDVTLCQSFRARLACSRVNFLTAIGKPDSEARARFDRRVLQDQKKNKDHGERKWAGTHSASDAC